jgi:hypothetical protein
MWTRNPKQRKPCVQLSYRADGVLCADALRGVTIVLDFPNRRVAIVEQKAPARAKGGWGF